MVKNIDLAYFIGNYLEIPTVEKIHISLWDQKNTRMDEFELKDFKELNIFGIRFAYDFVYGYPSPHFSLGEVKKTEASGYTNYKGLIPTKLEKGVLFLEERWESSIDQYKDGSCSVYISNARSPSEDDAILLEKHIPFDPKKQLVYVRSPNGSIKFEKVLHTLKLEEPEDYKMAYYTSDEILATIWMYAKGFDDKEISLRGAFNEVKKALKRREEYQPQTYNYSLVYENLENLRKGKNWIRFVKD